jgi:tetratricopeptide (TPR) repeat protein
MKAQAVLRTMAAALVAGALHAGEPVATPDPAKFIPESARVLAAEGNKAFEAGDYEGARKAYAQVLELAPDNIVALVNLGASEFKAGRHEEAEALLGRAVRIRMETAPAWLTLGILYYEKGRLDEALAALAQAALYDPRNPRVRNFLGATLGEKGWKDGAEAELRLAVEIDPNYRDAHFNLALLYVERKPPAVELAKRHYYRALELGAAPDKELEKRLAPAPQAP